MKNSKIKWILFGTGILIVLGILLKNYLELRHCCMRGDYGLGWNKQRAGQGIPEIPTSWLPDSSCVCKSIMLRAPGLKSCRVCHSSKLIMIEDAQWFGEVDKFVRVEGQKRVDSIEFVSTTYGKWFRVFAPTPQSRTEISDDSARTWLGDAWWGHGSN